MECLNGKIRARSEASQQPICRVTHINENRRVYTTAVVLGCKSYCLACHVKKCRGEIKYCIWFEHTPVLL